LWRGGKDMMDFKRLKDENSEDVLGERSFNGMLQQIIS
jgi:hypothetical protein